MGKRLCFVGAGNHMAKNIFPAAIEAGVEFAGIATRHAETAAAAAKKYGQGCPAFGDYRAMLREVPCDGVVVVAQYADMYDIALDCIRTGRNVFADKPLGWTAAEAKTLADEAARRGVTAMVGFMKRYAPCYGEIKKLIDSGELGPVRSFAAHFRVNSTRFAPTHERFMKAACIHIVDLLRYLFGEIEAVRGLETQAGPDLSECFAVKTASGASGSVYFTSSTAWSREDEGVLVTFERGFAQSLNLAELSVHRSRTEGGAPYAALTEEDRVFTASHMPMSGPLRDLYLRGFVGEMAHFCDCLSTGAPPLSSALENAATMALCEQMLAAIAQQ